MIKKYGFWLCFISCLLLGCVDEDIMEEVIPPIEEEVENSFSIIPIPASQEVGEQTITINANTVISSNPSIELFNKSLNVLTGLSLTSGANSSIKAKNNKC